MAAQCAAISVRRAHQTPSNPFMYSMNLRSACTRPGLDARSDTRSHARPGLDARSDTRSGLDYGAGTGTRAITCADCADCADPGASTHSSGARADPSRPRWRGSHQRLSST